MIQKTQSWTTALLACARCSLYAVAILQFNLASMGATTNPSARDSDGDGFLDGPNVLQELDGQLYWRIGEDWNGNGKYERMGTDQIIGTYDDEFDPQNARSHSSGAAIVPYEDLTEFSDWDQDGLPDAAEDLNLDGVFQPRGVDAQVGTEDDETDFRATDWDVDDDGLSNKEERERYGTQPRNPDTDEDGLPDGLEVGVTEKLLGPDGVEDGAVNVDGEVSHDGTMCDEQKPLGHENHPAFVHWYYPTDQNGLKHADDGTSHTRSCFIPDSDPTTHTDPKHSDTNFQYDEDGKDDANFNGRVDQGEIDPLAGVTVIVIPGRALNVKSVGDKLLLFPDETLTDGYVYSGTYGFVLGTKWKDGVRLSVDPPGAVDLSITEITPATPTTGLIGYTTFTMRSRAESGRFNLIVTSLKSNNDARQNNQDEADEFPTQHNWSERSSHPGRVAVPSHSANGCSCLSLKSSLAEAAIANPSSSDTDADDHSVASDFLTMIHGILYWRIGEDKDGDGMCEPARYDRITGTQDVESDPNNPAAHSLGAASMLDYEDKAHVHDADRDGLSDAEEDQNLNGKWDREQGESNFQDADSDDDGLSDAFESGLAPDSLLPFYDANEKLNACNPDTDGDGLPDGFEVGIGFDESGIPLLVQGGVSWADSTIAPSTQPRVPSTDIDATATFDYGGEKRKCFSPSTDMLSITDPTVADTNYDGALDGGHARADAQGFIHLDDEPGVGWNSSIAYGKPELSAPYRIKGIYTEKNGRIVYDPGDKGSNELKVVFQSPSDSSFDESSTSSILLMNDTREVITPQAKDSGSTEPAVVISIARMVPEKRLWLIRVEFTGNYDTSAPRAEQVTRISIDPARNITHRRSRSAPVAIPDIFTEFDWSLHVAPQGCQIID